MPRKSRTAIAQAAPHSWSVVDWPQHVYPHDAARARYVIRANRRALIDARAITRVGRDLVILGDRYAHWLEGQVSRVESYQIAPNRGPAHELGVLGPDDIVTGVQP